MAPLAELIFCKGQAIRISRKQMRRIYRAAGGHHLHQIEHFERINHARINTDIIAGFSMGSVIFKECL